MSAWNGLTRWGLITLVFASILLTGIGESGRNEDFVLRIAVRTLIGAN